MRTIGLLGGTSWESTLEYYRIINKEVSQRLGKLHSAKIAMYSIDFQEMQSFVEKNDFKAMLDFLIAAAKKVEAAGAECLLICANTPHIFADEIHQSISIPLIHIADVTAKKIKEKGFTKAGLLGTKLTMELPFYTERLKNNFNIDVIVPPENVRSYIHQTIIGDFFAGRFTEETKKNYLSIMNDLKTRGAECIILGCTEIPLLVQQSDTDIPLFDTLDIHAKAAVDFALQ
ncbi:MAG TPA: aspartate/glutamate racemase family protein [Bacteroidales bacterium]|nr:aspartate/glutamate racemase family protein [Bacteroidales bacterium]HPS17563.1 aspartate/glutamate racemase family protein [Bacteroidales bacterium]